MIAKLQIHHFLFHLCEWRATTDNSMAHFCQKQYHQVCVEQQFYSVNCSYELRKANCAKLFTSIPNTLTLAMTNLWTLHNLRRWDKKVQTHNFYCGHLLSYNYCIYEASNFCPIFYCILYASCSLFPFCHKAMPQLRDVCIVIIQFSQ